MSEKVLWSGRFEKGPDRSTIEFTSSIGIDVRLAWFDVMGSIAHARMLEEQGIITSADGEKIIEGLQGILQEIVSGQVRFDENSEDVHSSVELLLTKRIGEAGARLHTARSRNDQVVTDLRMFMREAIIDAIEALVGLEIELTSLAERHRETVMPGFTHVQHAQPVTLGFHLMAHAFKLQRDAERLMDSYERVNVCPLGSAALAGTTYPIDRQLTSNLLGFDHPSENAMDTVSDRDFALEHCFISSLTMCHLSSMAEELVLWSSPEFGFVEISDGYSTGSSIMPQKKNPDVAELIRGRTARGTGALVSMFTLIKGLPLSYNRDLQEDKESLFRSHDNLLACIRMMTGMIHEARFQPENMRRALKGGFLNATDLADHLVKKGMPFRQSHEVVGRIVRHCIERKICLEDLSDEEMRGFSDLLGPDARGVIVMDECVRNRTSYGGTAPAQVDQQIWSCKSKAIVQSDFCFKERDRLVKTWNALLDRE